MGPWPECPTRPKHVSSLSCPSGSLPTVCVTYLSIYTGCTAHAGTICSQRDDIKITILVHLEVPWCRTSHTGAFSSPPSLIRSLPARCTTYQVSCNCSQSPKERQSPPRTPGEKVRRHAGHRCVWMALEWSGREAETSSPSWYS